LATDKRLQFLASASALIAITHQWPPATSLCDSLSLVRSFLALLL
jgi:hypothetical protein